MAEDEVCFTERELYLAAGSVRQGRLKLASLRKRHEKEGNYKDLDIVNSDIEKIDELADKLRGLRTMMRKSGARIICVKV